MARPNIWLLRRMVFLAVGIVVFGEAIHADTNFGPVAGLICGAFVFAFVLFVVIKNSVTSEQIFLPTSPCWPPGKYPQAYWFTWGIILFVSAAVNLMIRLSNSAAVSLYTGFLLLGVGAITGAVVAHYQVRRKKL